MLKKSYTLEEIYLEMIQRIMVHPEPSYRRSLFQNAYLTDEDLKTMMLNDPDKNIRKEASEELEKRIDAKRRRKRTTKVVDYFKMDLKGISIGNEDFEDLLEIKQEIKDNKINSIDNFFSSKR